MFAVDCQTWVMSVLGAPTIDGWFGSGTALNIWNTAMKLGGYVYVFFSIFFVLFFFFFFTSYSFFVILNYYYTDTMHLVAQYREWATV
jgi:hypothetical protein